MAALVVVCSAETAHAQRAWRTPGESEAQTARRLAAGGRCDEALAPFDAAVESRSGDSSLRRDRGICHERLGHPAPAIEDYRAYLSMEPTAQDAASIRTRLDALEADDPSAGAPPVTAGPSAAPEAERDGLSTKQARPQGLPDPGDFTLGLHIGEQSWSARGYAEPTVSYGLAGSFSYAKALELDASLVLLRTNFVHTSGFGAAVDNVFKIALDASRRWEIALSLGVGLQSQSGDARVSRLYLFGHASPKLRFSVSGPIMIEAGPEAGTGLMDQEALPGEPTSKALTFFYGGYVRLLWVIRGS